MSFVVAAFYKFAPLPDFADCKAPLAALCCANGVTGTILLASEGVNGTIAGSRPGVDAALGALRALPGCGDLEHKESFAAEPPFHRMKVRLKKEIVSMGVDDLDIAGNVGTYVDPQAWNALIEDPDVAVVDARNQYETRIGAFEGAIDPKTDSFRDFPDWLRKFAEENRGKKLAMYCTGGIRCEKATAFARTQGFEEVYHLKGGILKYLEVVPASQSRWNGQCYVFDGRVCVGHDLVPGDYELCRACGKPIEATAKESPDFVEGVSCPFCIDAYSESRRLRFAERQRQFELARERGQSHFGPQKK